MKTVIFDIGNVLITWEPQRLFEKLFATPAAIKDFLDETQFWATNGAIDRSSWQKELPHYQQKFPQYARELSLYLERYLETLTGYVPGAEETIGLLANRPIYAITNYAADTFDQTLIAYPLLSRSFADIIVSGREGITKPNPEIYELAFRRWKLEPENTVFIDDTLANVEAARALGMDAIHFTSHKDLRVELANRQLI